MDSGRRSNSYRSKNFRWARFKHLAKSQLTRFRLIEPFAKKMWRAGRLLFYTCKWRLAALIGTLRGTYARGVDVDKTCWVSPQRIVYCAKREFSAQDFKGHVVGGDWDRLEKRFEHLDVYAAFKQVCVEGRDWSETSFYEFALYRLNTGQVLWGCMGKTDLDQRCKDLEALFHKIRRGGYKSQRELLLSQHINDSVGGLDEVTVSIGRHGDLLFSDGAHRLAIAKLLGIERIPIIVAVRHPEWMSFREELLLYGKAKGGKTHQPITHPDLDDMPACYGCEERFTMIKENMSAKQGRLLDIGANLGYYCHRFEAEGFDCYAVEDSQMDLYFLRKLKRAEDKKFRVIAESVLECREITNRQFDVVLALNIFHHFLKTKESHDKLVDLLKTLHTKELFFESYCPHEPQMQGAYKNYAPDEFVEFLVRHGSLKRAECIGVPKGGGPLHKLS